MRMRTTDTWRGPWRGQTWWNIPVEWRSIVGPFAASGHGVLEFIKLEDYSLSNSYEMIISRAIWLTLLGLHLYIYNRPKIFVRLYHLCSVMDLKDYVWQHWGEFLSILLSAARPDPFKLLVLRFSIQSTGDLFNEVFLLLSCYILNRGWMSEVSCIRIGMGLDGLDGYILAWSPISTWTGFDNLGPSWMQPGWPGVSHIFAERC